jgi:thiamine-phosphate pyrophosphorylase
MSNLDFRLLLITDRRSCDPNTLESAIELACAAGIKAVQVREKDLPPNKLYAVCKDLHKICKTHNTRMLINDRADIALALDADGVHLTSQSLSPAVLRTIMPPGKLVGLSTHSKQEVKSAEQQGCDYVLFGPVYHTTSKIRYGEPQGLDKLQQVAASTATPVFAVGGITSKNAALCLECGAYGVAVISAILAAEDITAAVDKYRQAIGQL